MKVKQRTLLSWNGAQEEIWQVRGLNLRQVQIHPHSDPNSLAAILLWNETKAVMEQIRSIEDITSCAFDRPPYNVNIEKIAFVHLSNGTVLSSEASRGKEMSWIVEF
jgi:hypothetical protein